MPGRGKIFLVLAVFLLLLPAVASAHGYRGRGWGFRGGYRGGFHYGHYYRPSRPSFGFGFSYYHYWPRAYYSRPHYPPVVVIQREAIRERDYDRPRRGRDSFGRRY